MLMRRIAQSPIFVQSFKNVLADTTLYPLFAGHPYLPEFVALELMDAIWINEVYCTHTDQISAKFKDEMDWSHLDRNMPIL